MTSSWPPASGARKRLGAHQQPALGHRPRVEEVQVAAAGAGRVALRPIQQFEPRAVRSHRVEVELVVGACVLPATEDDAAVVEHAGIEVVALVERNLPDLRAVGVHHVQHERGFRAALVEGGELRLALVEQHGARLALPGRGERDAPVGR